MKNIRSFLVLTLVAILTFSCEAYLGDGINEDPNNPLTVPVTVTLPVIEVFIADVWGGDFSRHTSLLVQQCEGVARQWVSINNYSSLVPATLNTAWNNVYENILNELIVQQTTSIENEYHHYHAVSNILIAFTLMMSTDVWDQMPYSDAFLGFDNSSPEFDTQAFIYAEVYNLLNEAIGLLGGSAGNISLNGDTDVIYGGDLASWSKAAYALLARANLHQGNFSEALSALENSFTSTEDNMSYQYPDAANPAQWFRFNRDREGDIEFHPNHEGFDDIIK